MSNDKLSTSYLSSFTKLIKYKVDNKSNKFFRNTTDYQIIIFLIINVYYYKKRTVFSKVFDGIN
jgi:hypothetical protein